MSQNNIYAQTSFPLGFCGHIITRFPCVYVLHEFWWIELPQSNKWISSASIDCYLIYVEITIVKINDI